MCYVHKYDEFYRPAIFRVIRIITLGCQLQQNKKNPVTKPKFIIIQQFEK